MQTVSALENLGLDSNYLLILRMALLSESTQLDMIIIWAFP